MQWLRTGRKVMCRATSAGALVGTFVLGAPHALAAPHTDSAQSVEDTDPTRREARELARRAIDLMHAARWAEAEPLLDRAYNLVPAPTIALLDGEALEHLGHWLAAADRYRLARDTVLVDEAPQAFRVAVKQAGERLTQLEARIPKLVIAIRGPTPNGTLRVLLDATLVEPKDFDTPTPVDPGAHAVVAWLDGKEVVHERVTLAEGETRQVVIGLVGAQPLDSAPPAAPDRPAHGTQYTLGWVGLGLGAAATTFGVVTGAMMLDAKGNLDSRCNPTCPAGEAGELSRFRTTRMLSSVGYVTGFVSLALGAVLVLTDSGPERRAAPVGHAGGASVGVYGDGATLGLRGLF